MLYRSAEEFMDAPHKVVTLVGMSNVGKTRLAGKLPRDQWFHFSVDYRLGTAYLREKIIDDLKREMMSNERLARELREDSLRLDLRIEFTELAAISGYLGLLGDHRRGGRTEAEFSERQAEHRLAEMAALHDLPAFIAKARSIYGYPHLINDTSGSLCELVDPADPADPLLAMLLQHSLLVYIEPDRDHEARLLAAAAQHPKPLYYRPEFLAAALSRFKTEHGCENIDDVDPRTLSRWLFPHLLAARQPRYDHLARHGCRLSAACVAGVQSEADFLMLIAKALTERTARGDVAKPHRGGAG